MGYASDKETLKENVNQYAGGVGLVAFAFQFAIQLLEEIISLNFIHMCADEQKHCG
jgi:hypothetical protein